MKDNSIRGATFITALIFLSISVAGQETLSARQVIEKADKNMEGKSSISTMSMSIVRPGWERTLEFKNWIKGDEYAITLVTSPAKEKGMSFLKRGSDMWNYLPGIGRMIKLPPSMMSQGWMGSDYTNDDVLNETSLVLDYQQKFIGDESIEDRECHIIEMIPAEESNIVWGKVVTWVSKKDYIFMKHEYYDEDGYLVRTEKLGSIKVMDNRLIPTIYEIIPADEPDQKTIVRIKEMDFDVDIKDSFFSQQNMKRLR
ncbi:MAG: outer membrane lipoprotein-sorting protein [Bacteroidales bacterium]|nr:outer membrane lipoprotein-sorting protein [Bacteroidales bacterium]